MTKSKSIGGKRTNEESEGTTEPPLRLSDFPTLSCALRGISVVYNENLIIFKSLIFI
jgi:hypothetical protein